MSAIVPPLDYIPKLPAQGVVQIVNKVNELTDQLVKKVEDVVKQSLKLPKGCKCNDPRILNLKEQLRQAQELITKVQQLIPKVQTTVNTVNSIVSTAKAIKAAITAAQLFNPITAGAFIAGQLMLIQDATIVNAVQSLSQFSAIPANISSKIGIVVPMLQDAIGKLSSVCNGDANALVIPKSVENALLANNVGSANDSIDGVSDFNNSSNFSINGQYPSEFYNKFNVSDDDLLNRSDSINDIISDDSIIASGELSLELILRRQQELLTSILEAPSVVHKGQGTPNDTIGKAGDFFVDIDTKTVYGPKPYSDSWSEDRNVAYGQQVTNIDTNSAVS